MIWITAVWAFGTITAQAATPCAALAKAAFPHTTVTVAETVSSGTFSSPDLKEPLRNLPAFCRVAGVIKPSSDSDIRFEVWMPASGWNGKFQGIGNGGFAGSIMYGRLGSTMAKGYATASTDTGHRADGVNATWALDHPEKIADWGHRGIHETTVVAKAAIAAFYGTAPQRSYFHSCSNGGRQALMEAQRYPEDYDGIIAGAPANAWTHLMTLFAYSMKATLAEPGAYIPSAKLPAIQAAVRQSCDKLDGVSDGVLEVPTKCRPDFAALTCKGAESDQCLTAPQLTALKKIYAGAVTQSGKLVYAGFSPGGEAEPGGWGGWISGSAPEKSALYGFSTQYFKNMVYTDPKWDFRTLDVARELAAAESKTGSVLNATNPDLSRFHARGGKLILYHGWSDAAIPAVNAIAYLESVRKKMGMSRAGEFTRLFMVPGMQHCGGGSGPNSFGQGGPGETDPSKDINAALEQWVEKGVAPERIIASKVTAGKVERTRPLCAYPLVAKWKGSGSTDDAANFVCAK